MSCEELDFIAATAQTHEEVAGCRMTGGGFGGSCVALVQTARAEAVAQQIGHAYRDRYGRVPASFVTPAAPGARLIRL